MTFLPLTVNDFNKVNRVKLNTNVGNVKYALTFYKDTDDNLFVDISVNSIIKVSGRKVVAWTDLLRGIDSNGTLIPACFEAPKTPARVSNLDVVKIYIISQEA